MPVYDVTAPDGRIFEVTAPEGASQEQVLEYAKRNFSKAPGPAEMPKGTSVEPLQRAAGAPDEPSAVDRVNAAITGVNRGIVGLAGLPMDTAQNVLNLAKAGFGWIAGEILKRPDLMPELSKGNVGTSEWIADQVKKLGINTENGRPDDWLSRMLHQAGVVVGGSAVPGAKPSSVLPAAAGAAVAGEVSDNPLAPALGSMVPGAIAQAGRTVKQNVAERTRRNVELFKSAGSVPTVAQATENPFFRGLENLISKFPGGVGIMEKFVQRQQRELGAANRSDITAEQAGRTIEKAITGEGGFLERTKVAWQRLDDALAQKVGNRGVDPANTVSALDRMTSVPQGAENVAPLLNNPKLVQLRDAIKADIDSGGGMYPFDTLRALRTKVGSQLENAIIADVPQGELKALYGAMSRDLEQAAAQSGASREFQRQSNYYKARMERIEGVLDKTLGKNRTPEDVFRLIEPTNADQATRVSRVMRSLKPDERQVVTQTIIDRLGRALPSRQTAEGDVFSTETFLTNWNKMSNRAKAQLIVDDDLRLRLNSLAKVAENIRTGSKVFQNPSGTAGSFAAYSVYSAPIAAIATTFGAGAAAGGAVLGGALGSVGAARVTARTLTNPKFVEWLAEAPKVQPDRTAAHMARLGVIFNESDDTTRDDLTSFVNSLQGK